MFRGNFGFIYKQVWAYIKWRICWRVCRNEAGRTLLGTPGMTFVWFLFLLKSSFFLFLLKGVVHPKSENYLIIYILSCTYAVFFFFCRTHTKYFLTDDFQKRKKKNRKSQKNTIKLFLMHYILYALLNQICHIFHRLDICNIKALYANVIM